MSLLGSDQLTKQRFFADDFCVVFAMRGRWYRVENFTDVIATANFFQQLPLSQLFAKNDRVDRAVLLVKFQPGIQK